MEKIMAEILSKIVEMQRLAAFAKAWKMVNKELDKPMGEQCHDTLEWVKFLIQHNSF